MVKRLSFANQEKVRLILESPVPTLPSGDSLENTSNLTKSPLRMPNNCQDQERASSPRRTSENFDSPNRDRVQKNFKMTTKKTSFAPLQTGKNLLKFGLFEHRVIEDVNNNQDWRVRDFPIRNTIKL